MSLGGTQTTEQSLSPWMEKAAQDALKTSTAASQIGYIPYSGPDVAAFNPMQQAAFDGTNMAASAYGLPTAASTGLPQATTYAGGVQGYSSFPMYQQSVEEFRKMAPGQYNALMSMFVNPMTGAAPTYQPQSTGLLATPKGY